MPLYDGMCAEHGLQEDIFMPLKEYTDHGLACPECGVRCETVVAPVLTVGPMPSKTVKSGQIGREFTSNAEMRAYLRENPKANIVDKNDTGFRNHYDAVRNKAEANAKRQGYRDYEDKKAQRRKEKAAQKR